MANTKRRLPDQEGKIFIPYNIGGGAGDEHFINGGKLAVISVLAVANVLFLLNLYDGGAVWWFKLLATIATIIVDIYVIRLFVLDERYYYRLYRRLDDYRVTNPSVFWDIVSIQNTSEGALLTYSDLKTAMMVRLERDTITGKPAEFKETHIDAISDFYRLLNNNGYSFIQMNVMEQAGNDPRLQKLDELVVRADNKNIASLIEMEVAYIKNITRATLYESEYLLIYTKDLNKARYMATEINEFLYKILDGAYIGFRVMEAPEIMQFVKEMYGIKLFDPGDAMLQVFKKSSGNLRESFEIRSITYNNGKVEVFELAEEKAQRLKNERKTGKKKRKASKDKNKDKDKTPVLSGDINKNVSEEKIEVGSDEEKVKHNIEETNKNTKKKDKNTKKKDKNTKKKKHKWFKGKGAVESDKEKEMNSQSTQEEMSVAEAIKAEREKSSTDTMDKNESTEGMSDTETQETNADYESYASNEYLDDNLDIDLGDNEDDNADANEDDTADDNTGDNADDNADANDEDVEYDDDMEIDI